MKKFKNILTGLLFLVGFSFAVVNAQYDSNGIYIGNGSETYIPYNPYTGYGQNPNPGNNYQNNNQVCPMIFPSPYPCGTANYYCPEYGGYVSPNQCNTNQNTGSCIYPATQIYYFVNPGPNAPQCACPNGTSVRYNERCLSTQPFNITSPAEGSVFNSGQNMTISWTPGYTISAIVIERSYVYTITSTNNTNTNYNSASNINISLPASSSINSVNVTLPTNNSGSDLKYFVSIRTSDGHSQSRIFTIKSEQVTCINYADDQVHTQECRSTCPTNMYKSGNTCYWYTCPPGTVRRSSDNYCVTRQQTGSCIPPATVINYIQDPGPNAARCACPNGGGVGYNERCPNDNTSTCITYADDLIHTKECRFECPSNTYRSGNTCYYYNCPSGTQRRQSDNYCITITTQTCPPNSIPYSFSYIAPCICKNSAGLYLGVLVGYNDVCPDYGNFGNPKYCIDGTVVYGDEQCKDRRKCSNSWLWRWFCTNGNYAY